MISADEARSLAHEQNLPEIQCRGELLVLESMIRVAGAWDGKTHVEKPFRLRGKQRSFIVRALEEKGFEVAVEQAAEDTHIVIRW